MVPRSEVVLRGSRGSACLVVAETDLVLSEDFDDLDRTNLVAMAELLSRLKPPVTNVTQGKPSVASPAVQTTGNGPCPLDREEELPEGCEVLSVPTVESFGCHIVVKDLGLLLIRGLPP